MRRIDTDYLIRLGVDFFRLFQSCQAHACYNWNSDSYMSGRSIEDCFPGFSWLNILGKPYIDMWGRDKIKKAPVHQVKEYDDIMVLIMSDDPSLDSTNVKAKSNDLKEHFGREYFYNSEIENRKTVFKSFVEIGEYEKETDTLIHYVAPDFHRYYEYRSGIWWYYQTKDSDESIDDSREVAEMMVKCAQLAIDLARSQYKKELDFSIESIKEVEDILTSIFFGSIRNITNQDDASKSLINTTALIWGGYIGEVVRRHHGGEWCKANIKGEKVITLRLGDAMIFPPAKVYKRLTNGTGDNVWFYLQALDLTQSP